jgi:hypothetical protein
MTDSNKPQVAPVSARPAPRMDEVRRLLGRYSRIETVRPRGARTAAVLAAPERKRGD